MDVKEMVQIAMKMAYQGKRYESIRKHLTSLNSSPNNVDEALEDVNLYIADYLLAKQGKSKAFNLMLIAGMILFLGLSITIISYLSSKKSYVLAYGAILGGAWGLKESYKVYRQPIEAFLPKSNRMKRKSKFGR